MSELEQESIPTNGDDILWRHLKTAPAFRALLRAIETRFYQVLDLPQPTLDIGCGDGHFARITFDQPIQFAIDTSWGKLNNARKQGIYEIPLQASSIDLPFPDQSFNSAISNSTLEHIPNIQAVLDETNRILKPGATFAFTVPSQYFTQYLGGTQLFDRVGLGGLSTGYGNLFNQISQHDHLDPPDLWVNRLGKAGFLVDRWQYYFSENATKAFEKGHFAGLPSAVLYAITGHWILGPWESNLKWTERWARPHFEEPFPEKGAFLFFQARKVADQSIQASLPAANPFTAAELYDQAPVALDDQQHILPVAVGAASEQAVIGEVPGDQIADGRETGSSEERAGSLADTASKDDKPSSKWRPLISGILVGLTLMLAFWGQAALRAGPQKAGIGLTWFGLSALMILALVWLQRQPKRPSFQLPKIGEIPRRRWLYPLALLFSLLVYRFGSQGQVALAFILWIAAIALAIYALIEAQNGRIKEDPLKRAYNFRLDLLTSVILFFVALLPRIYELSSHPFILNGTEAGIGLDVLSIVQGNGVNPFATGWLTNPTLPNYLLAIPVSLLGPSVFSIRLISPFLGAFTVAALYLIGRRLYGRAIGLTAAILLLGSHFHVHFSRLGLTNAWDSLLVLLSLGLIAIAWHADPEYNRPTWMLAGVATGLNAYLYTSSHLLPLILFGILILTFIFEPKMWRRQWRHILVMMALALIIALPQLQHYQANPSIFMERANVLGILDNQNGWLSREAAQTGISEMQLFMRQLWRAGMAFNATLDTGSSYGPMVPLLNFVAGALALLGYFITFVRIKKLRYSLLFVWISVTIIFAGALLENPPGSHRYIIAAPAVMLVAAIALVELMMALFDSGEKEDQEKDLPDLKLSQQLIMLIIPLIIAAALALYDLNYYFTTYKTEHNFADRNTEIANDMAEYLNSLQGDWAAYFYGPPNMYVGFSTIPFLVQDFREGNNLFDVNVAEDIVPSSETSNLSFIYLPERYNEIENTIESFPDGEVKLFEGYYANPLFYVYEVREEP